MTDATDQATSLLDPVAGARSARDDRDSCVIESGARVLRQEAEALRTLADQLDDAFARAVSMIAGIRGRVVVTGMG
ncbi:MAG TPA: KpsF/GutQ family sugar-phosphate isomerase, partial [Azospirillaceae bacterium]|nr:KpsF/GutQ family sugar-phosphate isomerase [Azospirillaceae bacterium]